MDDIWYAEITDEVDFYKILRCDECSTTDQINAEYKVLVRELHPDKRPNDPVAAEKFNKIQRARDVLASKASRADYDNWRRSGLNIPYDMWLARKDSTHVSLHWAIKKQPQQALEDSDTTPAGSYEGDIEWKRDTSDEILKKFRNYQI